MIGLWIWLWPITKCAKRTTDLSADQSPATKGQLVMGRPLPPGREEPEDTKLTDAAPWCETGRISPAGTRDFRRRDGAGRNTVPAGSPQTPLASIQILHSSPSRKFLRVTLIEPDLFFALQTSHVLSHFHRLWPRRSLSFNLRDCVSWDFYYRHRSASSRGKQKKRNPLPLAVMLRSTTGNECQAGDNGCV